MLFLFSCSPEKGPKPELAEANDTEVSFGLGLSTLCLGTRKAGLMVNLSAGHVIHEDSLVTEVSKQTAFSDQLIEITLAFRPMETREIQQLIYF